MNRRQRIGNFNVVPWPALLLLAAVVLAAGALLSGETLAQAQTGGESLPAPSNLHQLYQPNPVTPCGVVGLRWDRPPGAAAPQFKVQRKYGGEAQWQDSARMDRPPGEGQSGYVVQADQYPGTTSVVHYLSGTAEDGVCDFRVRLTAGGKAGPWSELAVRPAVNRPPSFPARAVERKVAENLPVGASMGGPATAIDPDGDALSYAIAGDDAASFSVDSSSGQITSRSSLDYEEKNSYRFFLSATDGEQGADAVPVVVVVDDENDPPAFRKKSVKRVVDENALAGAVVGRPVVAADQDGDGLTYRFHRHRLSDKFAIDPSTGQVTSRVPLDHESIGRYDTIVRVSDGRGGVASVKLVIAVRNLEEPGDLVVVPASPVVGVAQVATLSDPDVVSADTVSWTWQRSDTNRAPWTAIDGASTNSYTPVADDDGRYLRVEVSYSDGYGDGNRLRRKLGPVESAPDRNRPPRFKWSTVPRTVSEDAEPGSKVGGPITAVDPDGDALTYVLSGDDAGLFSIKKATGQLKTAAFLDFEGDMGNQHTLTVTADDGRGGTDSILVTVRVGNVNEPGSITLFPAPPRVGVKQKAILEDPDLVVRDSQAWVWERSSGPEGPWSSADPPSKRVSYVPSAADAGLYFRVTVTYDDGAGTGNTVSAVSQQVEVEEAAQPAGGTSTVTETDGGAPTVRISGPQGPVTDLLKLDVVFSEPVTGLEKGDFVAVSKPVTGLEDGDVITGEKPYVMKVTGSEANYSAYVFPYRNGEIVISLPANAVQDLSGNGNVPSEPYRAQAFLNRPQVEIYRYEPGPVNGPFEVYVSFSEDVQLYDHDQSRSKRTFLKAGPGVPEDGHYLNSMERIRVENGMVTGLRRRHVGGPRAPYTLQHFVLSIVPAGSGPVTVEMLDWAGYVQAVKDDVLYYRGSEPARRSFESDLYRPAAVITGPDGPVSGPFEVVLTFSHPVKFFHAGDLAVTNGAAEEVSLDANGTVQRSVTVTIVPAGDGPVVVSLPTGAVELNEYATSSDPVLSAEALKGNFPSNELTVTAGSGRS